MASLSSSVQDPVGSAACWSLTRQKSSQTFDNTRASTSNSSEGSETVEKIKATQQVRRKAGRPRVKERHQEKGKALWERRVAVYHCVVCFKGPIATATVVQRAVMPGTELLNEQKDPACGCGKSIHLCWDCALVCFAKDNRCMSCRARVWFVRRVHVECVCIEGDGSSLRSGSARADTSVVLRRVRSELRSVDSLLTGHSATDLAADVAVPIAAHVELSHEYDVAVRRRQGAAKARATRLHRMEQRAQHIVESSNQLESSRCELRELVAEMASRGTLVEHMRTVAVASSAGKRRSTGLWRIDHVNTHAVRAADDRVGQLIRESRFPKEMDDEYRYLMVAYSVASK